MKIYNTTIKSNRASLLSKHLSSKKSTMRRKLSNGFLSNCQKKSRYHHLKSRKSSQLQPKHQKKQKPVQMKDHETLEKLRREAYDDLHAQVQHYNNEFIANMRYMESNSASSADSLCSTTSEESEMQDLVELFEAGTVKDYSQLIEWESFQNPPAYFECQGEYGDLW